MQTRLKNVLTFLSFALATVIGHSSGQSISGAITTDTTWTLAGSPVVVSDSTIVLNGATLTVEPGVVVKFDAGASLVIGGGLLANGTSGNLITFTSNAGTPAPGDWNGVTFLNTASPSSSLDYCVLEYGGNTVGSIIFYSTGAPNIPISNSTVRRSSGHGVNTRASSPVISNSILRDNTGYGVFSNLLSNFVLDASTVVNNTSGGVRIPINSSSTVQNSIIDSNTVGVFVDANASPTIQSSSIRKNDIGIQFTEVGSTQPTITQDTISGNVTWGFLNTGTSEVLAAGNYWGSDLGPYHPGLNPTGTGDKVSDLVDFTPWTTTGPPLPVTEVTTNLTTDTTWTPGVYWIKNNFTLSGGLTLTLEPGVVVKLAPNVYFKVWGTLDAVGTSDSLIVFTSEKDDSYGGDTNGDGTTTAASKGDWAALWLENPGADGSVLEYCLIRFGGAVYQTNLRVINTSPSMSHITSTHSQFKGAFFDGGVNTTISDWSLGANNSHGIDIWNSQTVLRNVSAVNNTGNGINVERSSRVSIHSAVVQGNAVGLKVGGNSINATLALLDSSHVAFNRNGGVYAWGGTGTQIFSNNTIEGNLDGSGPGYGIWCFNLDTVVSITSNTVQNNAGDGIVTSRAAITGNTIQGNRYPIALLGNVNSSYSGNTISGNTFNNALGLRNAFYLESFTDTLKAEFPSAITSNAYVLIENSSAAVAFNDTLVIQPGVVVKMSATRNWRIEGTLLAQGSAGSPVVFTSYRDASYGGKTNLATDTNPPAPGDWGRIELVNAQVNGSVIEHVNMMYGGTSTGALYLGSGAQLTLSNIVVRHSRTMGIYVENGVATFENAVVDSNLAEGIYIFGSKPAEAVIRYSTIQDNGKEGLRASGVYKEVLNCTIRRNGGWGIGASSGYAIPQIYQGNVITENAKGGIFNRSAALSADQLLFVGNTVSDHPEEGILSTAGTFIDNTIVRNRYPLSVWGNLGNIYTDPAGVDGNVIADNTYNNAIAIGSTSDLGFVVGGGIQKLIMDTLSTHFPAAMSSQTYVAINDLVVQSNTTLVIEPGVNLKFHPTINASGIVVATRLMEVSGTLIADGTAGSPIYFTSWRDGSPGGKTNSLTDTVSAGPGDWGTVIFNALPTEDSSVVRHCLFNYGGGYSSWPYAVSLASDRVMFTENTVRRSARSGIGIFGDPVVLDRSRIDSSEYGIRVADQSGGVLTLRNSEVVNNSKEGVWVEPNGDAAVISDCLISFNGGSGVKVQKNTVPLTVLNSEFSNNGVDGLHLLAENDAVDTLLLIAGNAIRNNGNTGLMSSRAYVIDDSITGNTYPVGVSGQLSLNGSGNVYQNVHLSENTYDAIAAGGIIFGRLGGAFPSSSRVVAVDGMLDVRPGKEFRVEPGTIVKFTENGYVQSNGSVIALGTEQEKIVFTSWKDDSYGGDTNADSNATVPAPGNWLYMFLASDTSWLSNTIVRYGGLSSGVMVDIKSNATAFIESCYVSFGVTGIRFDGNSTGSVLRSEIHDNTGSGIQVQSTASAVINHSNIYANNWGLANYTSNTIDASNNYWGDPSGPEVTDTRDPNLSGTGNRIVFNPGQVTYRPFNTTRSGVLFGDITTNGQISAYDASLVLQHTVGLITLTAAEQNAGDVSGDGTVSAFDASYILRYVVGLITGFPRLGKVSTSIPDYGFYTELRSADELDLLIRVRGEMPIYSAQLKLSFDSTKVRPIAADATELTGDMNVARKLSANEARISMAGAIPVEQDGDLIRLRFRVLEDDWSPDFTLHSFVLNEMDLTQFVNSDVVSSLTESAVPTEFGLAQNYPNPFNPTTVIEYQVPTAGHVSLRVYDVLGRVVRTLVDRLQTPGFHHVTWDGRNSTGAPMASGVYFYRMETVTTDQRRFEAVRRMAIVK